MAAAQKLRPAATQHASSPAGRPRLQSLFAAQESKGRQTSVLGASALEWLPYRAPCEARSHPCLNTADAAGGPYKQTMVCKLSFVPSSNIQ